MTDNDPITPPSELVKQWTEYAGLVGINEYLLIRLATQAAQWGADQELDACCDWFRASSYGLEDHVSDKLRSMRRPKPKSLKEQATFAAAVLQSPDETCSIAEITEHWRTIRRAIESLSD